MLFVDSITNMTMSDDILEHLAVCPLVADETDVGMEAPTQVWHQRVGGVLVEFTGRAFLALRFSLAALDR